MIVLDCIQGESEWLEARRAIPTSSCFSQILTSTGRLSSQWDNYMNKLLAEYVDPEESVANRVYTKDMKRGNELEPEARRMYEDITGNQVEEVGGLFLNDEKDSLCSPDGLIKSITRGIEIKCPRLANHIGYLRAGKMPEKYMIQVQAGMAFSSYGTWDFVSYHPSFDPFITTVEANPKLIREIKNSVAYFISELKIEKYKIDEIKSMEF